MGEKDSRRKMRSFALSAALERCRSSMGILPRDMNGEARKGNILRGGCIVSPDSKAYSCKKCEHEFGDLADENLGGSGFYFP